ncbi:sensor histidine kinase [Phocaeicola sp.]
MKWNVILYGLLFSGLGVFSYLLLVNYTELSPQVTNILYSKGTFIFFIAAFNVLGFSTLRLSSWLNDQYAVNIRQRWKIIAIYIAVTLLFLLLNYSLLAVGKLLVGSANIFTFFPNGGWRILILVWLVELVIVGLLLSNRSIQNTLKLQQEAAALQKENNTARYAALQNQLNPHFLFNSLNTLIAEIEYNPGNAVRFTKHLSSVYRYVLQGQNKTLITLGEELEFMQSYLFLHEVRLGNCISCNCHIPADYNDAMLPPLTLQLLVENVIKHNSITSSKPMQINIGLENNYLIVSNPIHPKKSQESSSGVGLKNLSNRCRLMLGEEIIIAKEEGIFTVKVPLLYE